MNKIEFYKETNFKETPIGKIPEDWQTQKLGSICKFKRGFSYRSNQITNNQTPIRFITINDIEKEGGLKRTAEKIFIRDPSIVNSEFLVSNGDVLIANTDMAKGFIIGAPILIKNLNEDCAYSMDLTKLIFDKTTIYGDFLFYYLTHPQMRQKMKSSAQGTNVLHLNHELISDFLIPLPPVVEQRAIADVLSVVDLAIQKTDEVIARTERLKKGLMQTLLTRGIGHKEYKETPIGKIPKTWQIVKLRDVAKGFISGGTPSTKNPNYWNGNIPWIRSIHISKHYIDESAIEHYITEEGLRNSASNIVPKGNLIVATRVGIGKAAVNLIDVAINQDLTGILVDEEKLNPFFGVWYLLSPKIADMLEAFARGTTIKGIAQDYIKNLLIPLPPIHEQRKIADILLTIERKIEFEKNEKAKLESVKRGLMDLLFSGKVRVKVESENAIYSG